MSDAMTQHGYPVVVEAQLESGLSRWLWLVKWLLALPHLVVLGFLWIGFVALSVIAFFSILFTGRYPRSIFDFNAGVLRWSWRVGYYAFVALGTDRYPPFTLEDVEDYPAHLHVAYPERLSRGLVLVKSWLLAAPHYLVLGVLLGGGWIAWSEEFWGAPGLIGILVFVAGVVLAFTGTYPRGIFDLVVGLDRWVLRVAAYAALMTDEYPPFRLDLGASEDATITESSPQPAPAPHVAQGWTGGRVTAVALGGLLSLTGIGLVAGGGLLLWADRVGRDDAGFVSTPDEAFSTNAYAIVAEHVELPYPSSLLGEARVRVTARDRRPIFVGLARARDVARYLGGVERAALTGFPDDRAALRSGAAPDGPPGAEGFWVVSSQGAGTQTLRWEIDEGAWSLVVMNADASRGVRVAADAGAELPALGWVAGALLAAGAILLLIGGLLIGIAIARASRATTQPNGERSWT